MSSTLLRFLPVSDSSASGVGPDLHGRRSDRFGRCVAGNPPRRICRHHGPQRQRQIDAAEFAGHARSADQRRNLLRRQAALRHCAISTTSARRKIGFVFQSFYLLPTLTAIENVQIPMFEGSLSAAERIRRAGELLESVGMSHRAKHLPIQLSVGERQRVAIARALANEPPLLLADEPTGNLDSHSGSDVLDLFDQLHDERGMTLIVITHSLEVAERAERIIWIRDGRVAEEPVNSAPIVHHQRVHR